MITDEFLADSLLIISRNLSYDLSGDVYSRAAIALDENLAGRDLRTFVIQLIVDDARRIARGRAAIAEREATQQKLTQEYTQEPELTKREVGHKGPRTSIGWASKRNKCYNCQACREARDWSDELDAKHASKMAQIIKDGLEQYKAELFVEWTALLNVEIAMPDGSRTTWGLATVEQHQLRYDMLIKNAVANTENAARHALAIDQLKNANALNLLSLTKESVK